MTGFAIDVLAKNPEGYVLMVEAGRVDHAHHAGNAYRALTDMVAFADAVRTAVDRVNLDETLIVVTADHSHTLTISGYPRRGNPILGVVRNLDDELVMGRDGRPYTTLGYANGPGGFTAPPERPAGSVPAATASSTETSAASGNQEVQKIGVRPDPREADTEDADYIQQATVPLKSETHAGEDVTVHAIGPWAHLFQGVVEQHYLFHVMDHATKISEQANEAQRASAQ